jgi:hypothetical protein
MAWPTVVVPPKKWQAPFSLNVTPRPGESKESHRKRKKARHIEVASRLYPRASLLPSSRCSVPSDGIADAIIIAHYGTLQHAQAQPLHPKAH